MCRCGSDETGDGSTALLYSYSIPAAGGKKRRKEEESASMTMIRAFYLRLTLSAAAASLPKALTLVYLPRGAGSLAVNEALARLPPGAPAVVPLHRLRSGEEGGGAVVFASTDRVHTGEGGARFEVYVGAERAVVGRVRADGVQCSWKGEADPGALGVSEAEVTVSAGEKGAVLRGAVRMTVAPRRMSRGRSGGRGVFRPELEGIPEEEVEEGEEICGEAASEEWAPAVVDVDGVRWAVGVGMWVACVGVGLLVSKASLSSGRRRRCSLF